MSSLFSRKAVKDFAVANAMMIPTMHNTTMSVVLAVLERHPMGLASEAVFICPTAHVRPRLGW